MNNLKFSNLVCFSTLAIILSCKQKPEQENSLVENSVSETLIEDNSQSIKVNLDSIIDNYAKSLSNSQIKILDRESCKMKEQNIESYENGTYTYEFNSITDYENGKTIGDLNGDGKDDYIINYDCQNCFDGIGAGNYLSNCFILTSKDKDLLVDENLTLDFKQKLIDKINKDFGNSYYSKASREELINGIVFKKIHNQIAYGEFSINTEECDGSPHPCFNGKFEYNAKSKSIKMELTK